MKIRKLNIGTEEICFVYKYTKHLRYDLWYYIPISVLLHYWVKIDRMKCTEVYISHPLSSILAINWNEEEKRSIFRLLFLIFHFIYFVIVSENETKIWEGTVLVLDLMPYAIYEWCYALHEL